MKRQKSFQSQGRPFTANRTNLGSAKKTTNDGRFYPEMKQQGFYSDVLPQETSDQLENILDGPQVAQDTLWQVSKEKHTPSVATFIGTLSQEELTPPPKGPTDFGPSTEITDISDFPEKSYQPKVQLPFFTPPGHCPRKIEIERRKRDYAKQDIVQLLRDKGIETNQLMPKHQEGGMHDIQLNADPNNPAPFPPYLQLHIFDNKEDDCRNPDEWLSLGVVGDVRKPVPGKALLPTRDDVHDLDPKDPTIEYNWFNVGVLDYDEEMQCYYVQKVNANGRIVDIKGVPIVNGGLKSDGTRVKLPNMYWVPRIRLMFCAEDPRGFARRVSEAYQGRRRTEALLRYHLYIDCMPMEGVGELDQASLRRMTEWAKGTPTLMRDRTIQELEFELNKIPRQANLDDYIQVLEKEINIDFCRSMNKIIFDKTVNEDPKTFAFVTLPKKKKVPTATLR